MKLVVYGPSSKHGLLINEAGKTDGKTVVDLLGGCAAYLANSGEANPHEMAGALVGTDLMSFINGGDRALDAAGKVLDFARKGIKKHDTNWNEVFGVHGEKIFFEIGTETKLNPPLVNSYKLKVMCAGANYPDHAAAMFNRTQPPDKRITQEQARDINRKEVFRAFYKLGGNIVGDGDFIPYPTRASPKLDYEGEVAIIFGKVGKDIPATKYLDYVFGVTLFNDLSIRDKKMDRQNDPLTLQLGKNFDSSGVLGPCIVTKDEIRDPANIDFGTKVNGESRQQGNTKNMMRSFGEYTEIVSDDLVIHPGDILTAGTCAGTAADSSPVDPVTGVQELKRFLKIGDTVEVFSNTIGSITNRIVAKKMT